MLCCAFSTNRSGNVRIQYSFANTVRNNDNGKLCGKEKYLKNNKPNSSSYKNLIGAYEAMEDSINANKLIEESKLNLTDKEVCELYTNIAMFIGNPNPFNKRQENMTNYHQRKALQYLQNALTVCDEEEIHPNNGFAIDAL